MTNNCIDKLVSLIRSQKVLVEKHPGCDQEREHIERIGNQHFRIEDDNGNERDISDDGFLLVFSLLPLAETNHEYNNAKTVIFEMVAKDHVQMSEADCVFEPYLCAATIVRRDYLSLYETEKAKLQQAWKDYDVAAQKLAELKLSTPLEVKAPSHSKDEEPNLPPYCYDTVYAIDFSSCRWSIYADKNTEIWKALIRAGIEL